MLLFIWRWISAKNFQILLIIHELKIIANSLQKQNFLSLNEHHCSDITPKLLSHLLSLKGIKCDQCAHVANQTNHRKLVHSKQTDKEEC